jgi:hypothetical protein
VSGAHPGEPQGPDVNAGQEQAEPAWSQPAGSALLDGVPVGAPVDPNPEKLVGAAFAGGLVAALFLKRLARRRHVR